MRKSGLLIFASLLGVSSVASAQDVTEAFNLSNLSAQGTARSMGFGNALGSVGGDFGSLSVNPAGIGVYRSSELTLTPSLKINAAQSDYTSVTSSDNHTNFNFNNFGIILTDAPKGKRYDRRAWKTVSFGFGMNRVADFNGSYYYNGKNTTSSVSQAFESDANLYPGSAGATEANNSLGYMGYNSYLLNINDSGHYESIVPYRGGINQVKSKTTKGGIKEYTVSLGGNFREKLLLGVTMGIPVVNYHSKTYFQESIATGNNDLNPSGFRSSNYSQSLDLTGAGVNLKLGAIYKFSDAFRIGVAFHTPTVYTITDVYNQGITTVRNNGGIDSVSILSSNDGSLPTIQSDYQMITPWKGVLSATFIIKGVGFITADYEYVDYPSASYILPEGIDGLTGVPFQTEADQINQQIKKTYTGASNFRIGAEGVVNKHFMIRAGYGYYGNAYSAYGMSGARPNYTTERMDISIGAGFHFNQFFADLALVHGIYSGKDQPYAIDYAGVVTSGAAQPIPTSSINYNTNNIALTIGTKFGGHHDRRN